MEANELATANLDLAKRVNALFFKGQIDHEDFEDGQSEAMLELWRAALAFNGEGSFRGYAASRIRRRLIDQLRWGKRRYLGREVMYSDDKDKREVPPLEKDTMALRNMRKAIRKLSERNRALIHEAFWGGESKRATATRLGYVSVGTYWQHLDRAQKQLRAILGE